MPRSPEFSHQEASLFAVCSPRHCDETAVDLRHPAEGCEANHRQKAVQQKMDKI
jgi:hypothetical protein